MQSIVVDKGSLLPDAAERVAKVIRGRVRKARIAAAESKDMMSEAKVSGKKRRELYAESRLHNAEAISQAGKALESLFALCKGLIANERLSRTTAGKKHNLKPLYDGCIKSARGEKSKHLRRTFDCAYQDALHLHFTDVHVDGDVVGTIVDPPFSEFSSHGMYHGQVIYQDEDFGAFGRFGRTSRGKGRSQRLDTIGGYLSVFDNIAQEFVVNKEGKWNLRPASWRNMDYDARENSSSWTVLNGDFFGDFALGLLPILDDSYFWHEEYFAAWMASRGVMIESKVLDLIRQNWSREIAREVMGKLSGTIQDQQVHEFLRDRPQKSQSLKSRRKQLVRKVEFSSAGKSKT